MSGLIKHTLTCLIIDDERPAHAVLEYHIANTPWLQSVGNLYNAVDAITVLQQLKPDLIFLDVHMPNLSGLQLLDIIKLPNTAVILTSAFPEYAINGYHYDITSFLLKPITFDQFLKAVNKVLLSFNPAGKPIPATGILNLEPSAGKELNAEPNSLTNLLSGNEFSSLHCAQDAIWIRKDKRSLPIRYELVSFIESEKNYVKVYWKGGQTQSRGTLNYLEENLPAGRFVRTHRSYIVNRHAIRQIEGNMITMDNDFRVSISPADRLSVIKLLQN